MNTTTELSFIHRFEPAGLPDLPPVLLLHGTGADENDLIGLGRAVAPGAALLSPRGKVLENGMPRFFRRLAEGRFDEEDLRRRTEELADFIGAAREAYGLAAPIALGFSNGANIAAAMLLMRPEVLAGAALIRAMPPFADPPEADLAGKPVLMLSGSADPLVPLPVSERLAAQLADAGARVEYKRVPGGHGLTQIDVAQLGAWFKARG